MTDILLAIAHHLLVFSLAAVLAAELILAGRPPTRGLVPLLAKLDTAYGLLAMSVLAAGALRVMYGAKGAQFFLSNPVFWAKIGVFALIGILSIGPTRQIFAWRRAARGNAQFVPLAEELARMRRIVLLEAALFPLLPILAVLMARGVGAGMI
jgi:putative membrane protein